MEIIQTKKQNMSKQIFREKISKILFDLLEMICLKTHNYFCLI